MSTDEVAYTAIIVAGGSGKRAGGGVPKQLREVAGRPMLWWSMKAFREFNEAIRLIVVLHPDFYDMWHEQLSRLPEAEQYPHEVVAGGSTRTESVFNGLKSVTPKSHNEFVAVHDAARPMVRPEMIKSGFETCRVELRGVVPVTPLTDSIRRLTADGESEAANRADFVAVQTPQIFPLDQLVRAYAMASLSDGGFTDDASVAEAAGMSVGMYAGAASNIKVTYPADFAMAEHLLGSR